MQKRESDTHAEKNAKDELVVSCQPLGKVDIEVLPPIARVACRDRRERTAPLIESQDQNLTKDDGRQPHGSGELPEPRDDRDGDDAAGEERPYGCVQRLDRSEPDCGFGLQVDRHRAAFGHLTFELSRAWRQGGFG